MKTVELSFFEQDTITIAKELIGIILSVETCEGQISGKIVETEAYLGSDNPATHSFNGETNRTAPMFAKAGNIYVYLIYGIHYCFNFSTEKEGIGNAVLIRALEPVNGIDIMKKNRNKNSISELCNGPGKLCQALGIDIKYNDQMVGTGKIKLFEGSANNNIITTTRIGINKAKYLPLRFLNNSPFVSKI